MSVCSSSRERERAQKGTHYLLVVLVGNVSNHERCACVGARHDVFEDKWQLGAAA